MNTRRPTDAAGESWRKWGDRPDPDPLHVDEEPANARSIADVVGPDGSWSPREMAAWRQGHDVGRWEGAAATPRWRRILGLIVLAIVVALVIGYALGGGRS